MGIYFRRRVRLGKGAWLNLSRSGVSVSEHVGPVTVNSRGTVWTRLGGGLYWRGRPSRSAAPAYPYWAQLVVGISVCVALVILALNLG